MFKTTDMIFNTYECVKVTFESTLMPVAVVFVNSPKVEEVLAPWNIIKKCIC